MLLPIDLFERSSTMNKRLITIAITWATMAIATAGPAFAGTAYMG